MKQTLFLFSLILALNVCYAQKINLLTDPSDDMGPKINYIQTVNGEKYMLTLAKVMGYYRSMGGFYYSTYDSLVCNSSGLVLEEYTSPIYTEYGKRKTYQYNDKGLKTSVEMQSWEKGEWTQEARGSFEYTPFDKISSFLFENIGEDSTWAPVYKFVYAYDNNNRVSQITKFEKDTASEEFSVKTRQLFYEYNARGLLTYFSDKRENEMNLLPYVRHTMRYDDNDKIIDSVYYYEVGSTKATDSTRYYRNKDGLISRKIHYNNDPMQMKDSIEYYYNDQGKLDSMLTFAYSGINQDPYYRFIHRYNYDNSGKISHIDQQMIFEYSNSTERRRFNYDANEYFTGWYWCYLDSNLQERPSSSKTVFTNDNIGLRTKIEYLIWSGYNDTWTAETEGKLTIPLPEVNDPLYYFNIAEFGYTAVPDIAVKDEGFVTPETFSLSQNYPNPFNPETKISFSLPQSGEATLKIYDTLGREVAELVNDYIEAGTHTVNFSGRNLSSGVYIYRLQSGSFTESKKMALIK